MLDLEQLRKELTAPVKTVKLQAIEAALKDTASSELLTLLENSLLLEQDPECQLLLQHAIDQNQLKIFGAQEPAFSLSQIIEMFPESTLQEQLNLIEGIKVKDIKDANPEITLPKLLEVTKNPVVASTVVRKFRRFWPENMLSFLEQNIFSKCKSLQLACIKTLVQLFPQSLKTRLSQIVHINDPVIRSLAIWSMARHFPELAAEFMNDCLEKGDHYNRLTALQICSTIDFSLIRQSLLNLITVETNAEIFKLACTILLNNPDREVPFILLGIITRTTKSKADFLRKFLTSYCANLELSGQCDDFATYKRQLNEYARRVQAQTLVYNLLVSYDNETESEQEAIIRHLRYNISDPDIRVAVDNFVGNCQNQELKAKLLDLLVKTSAEPATPGETPEVGNEVIVEPAKELRQSAPEAAQEETHDEVILPDVAEQPSAGENLEAIKIKELARARFRRTPEMKAQVKEVLDDQSSSEALINAALKAAVYVELPGYSHRAEQHLELASDVFVAAALEYLARFDWDQFHLLINRFINTESFLIRNVLIGATSRAAPEYAKFLIKHLLESRDRSKRVRGLEATVQMDFSYIFPDLVSFLEKEQDVGLIDSCIAVFLANPKLDSLCAFAELESRRPEMKKMFGDAAQKLRDLLVASGIAKEKEIDAFVARKATEKEARKAAMEQQKELVKIKNSLKWKSVSDQADLIEWQRPTLYILGAMAGFVLLFLVFGKSQSTKLPEKNAIADGPAKRPVISRDAIAPPIIDELAGLPKPGTQILMQLQKFYEGNQTWLARDENGRDLLVVLPEPETYIETEFIGVEVDEARYTSSGELVIFAR